MANKHTISDLYQMQSFPLEAKIKMTENRIRIWYEEFDGDVYVARSGGKDSDVLGHIVKRMYPDVPHVFVNTGLEFDSVIVFNKNKVFSGENNKPYRYMAVTRALHRLSSIEV